MNKIRIKLVQANGLRQDAKRKLYKCNVKEGYVNQRRQG